MRSWLDTVRMHRLLAVAACGAIAAVAISMVAWLVHAPPSLEPHEQQSSGSEVTERIQRVERAAKNLAESPANVDIAKAHEVHHSDEAMLLARYVREYASSTEMPAEVRSRAVEAWETTCSRLPAETIPREIAEARLDLFDQVPRDMVSKVSFVWCDTVLLDDEMALEYRDFAWRRAR